MSGSVLLFGAHGQVGLRLGICLQQAGYDVTSINRAGFDFATADAKKLETLLCAVEPTCIINAAAYTAVDKAESQVEEATRINATMPGLMARMAEAQRIPFLHFSTDYVFEGSRGAPYHEGSPVKPINAYGVSKLAGEESVREAGGYVFRLQWVYDGTGKNFFVTMRRLMAEKEQLSIVADQLGAPSGARDIAKAICEMLPEITTKTLPPGIYHLAAQGVTSWHGFACAIAEFFRYPTRLIPITSEEYTVPAARPKDTRLDCSRMAEYGIRLPHWREGLAALVEEVRHEEIPK